MVAITVVLAATLYMMVGDIGGDEIGEFFGEASIGERGTDEYNNEYVRVDIDTMSPSSVDVNDVTVTLYDTTDDDVVTLDGEQGSRADSDLGENNYNLAWTRLTNEEVDTTSRLYVEGQSGYDFDGYEVVITVSGRSGSITQEL